MIPKLLVWYSMPLALVDAEIICFTSSANVIGAWFSPAIVSNTIRVSGVVSPITTGTPFLIIPAFSIAICSSDVPRNWVWSMPILVIIDRIGVMMLVQSRRPPSPTSITAMSTSISAKYLNAIAVVSSKNEGCSGSKNDLSFSTKSTTYASLMG